eukprot:COSAG02_NODE_21873_length_772_cov_0.762259_1_plen_159_part_00
MVGFEHGRFKMRCGSRIAVCGLVLAAYLAMQLFVSEQQKIQELERDNQRLTQDLQRVSGELANAQHATSVALTATSSSVAVSAPPSSQERSDHAMCSIHEGKDFSGWDLTSVALSSVEKCCDVCAMSDECAATTCIRLAPLLFVMLRESPGPMVQQCD